MPKGETYGTHCEALILAIAADPNRIREVVGALSSLHYSIPETAYWAVLITSFPGYAIADDHAPELRAVIVAAATGCVVGIARWHIDRRNTRGRMVIARFTAGEGVSGRQVEVQQAILTQLRDRLTAFEASLVAPIAATVGREDRRGAAQLAKRLRSPLLLHGHIHGTGGEWSVYARLLRNGRLPSYHVDMHTKDLTPARTLRASLVSRLTPEVGVADAEYPLALATELEVVVRGSVGLFVAEFDPARGLHELTSALALCPGSTSHQIDGIRAELARLLRANGQMENALELLRPRATGVDPSPELCRTLGGFLWELSDPLRYSLDDATRQAVSEETVQCYRTASETRSDPLRDQSLYNLALSTPDEAEAERLLAELLSTSRYYRGSWYVQREIGARSWRQFEHLQSSDPAAARDAVRRAARYYTKAIRSRPKVRLERAPMIPWLRVRRFERRPIMYANAVDAHRESGHRLRTWWLTRRMNRLRHRNLSSAERGFRAGDYDRAYAHADWAAVGIGDLPDLAAHVWRAVALYQRGPQWAAGAEQLWAQAVETFGDAAHLALSALIADPDFAPLPARLPWP